MYFIDKYTNNYILLSILKIVIVDVVHGGTGSIYYYCYCCDFFLDNLMYK